VQTAVEGHAEQVRTVERKAAKEWINHSHSGQIGVVANQKCRDNFKEKRAAKRLR
jgi:hypothetical protein